MSSSTVDRFLEHFDEGDAHAMVAMCAPDAVVDVNSPQWRYQVHPDALLAGLRQNTELPDRRVSFGYRSDAGEAAAVEVETRGSIDGEPVLVREAWLFRTAGEQVTEWIMYCTGPWDAATIDRQAREAPMLRS